MIKDVLRTDPTCALTMFAMKLKIHATQFLAVTIHPKTICVLVDFVYTTKKSVLIKQLNVFSKA